MTDGRWAEAGRLLKYLHMKEYGMTDETKRPGDLAAFADDPRIADLLRYKNPGHTIGGQELSWCREVAEALRQPTVSEIAALRRRLAEAEARVLELVKSPPASKAQNEPAERGDGTQFDEDAKKPGYIHCEWCDLDRESNE